MIRIELFDVGSDIAGPLGRGIELVPRFPTKNCRLVAICHAGERVLSHDHMADRSLEVVAQLRIGPEGLSRLAAKGGVFADAAPPLVLIHERENHADSLASSDLNEFVKRSEALFIELARRANVHNVAHVRALALHA